MCFFSARCRHSQNFLEELAKTPYAKEFRFISVDPQGGQRPPLPPYVKAVPTLMIDGEAGPRTDSQVMNWLSERRLKETGSAGTEVGPVAYTDEMSVTGDEFYSFLDEDTNMSKASMVRMVGTMASFDSLSGAPGASGGGGGGKSGGGGGGPQQSEKAKALDDALIAYQRARDQDMKSAPRPF